MLGLELGADDYVLKSIRFQGACRKSKSGYSDAISLPNQKLLPPAAERLLTIRESRSILPITQLTPVDGKNVDMPPKELELLYFLASSPNQVFTREQLLDQIWGYEYVGDTRTVDVHIKRLREKIKDHPSWGLSTVWGIGYKFEVK